MKQILVISLIFQFSVFSQQFHSLEGIEDSAGNTHLIYRLGSQYYHFNPLYKLNLKTGYEKMIMDAFYNRYPGGELAKAVRDFEFFPNDTANFVNCGYVIYPDNHGYIARNDSIGLGGMSDYQIIDISKQNPNKVFVSDYYYTYESSDAGYTYTSFPDSVLQFPLVSVASFDDKIFFGVDEDNNLIKSLDGGLTSYKGDASIIFRDQDLKFLYDVNNFHVYRVNSNLGGYSFHVSNNKGDALTWTKTYESTKPLLISIDPSQSGVVYLADGRKIYKSINNGYTFSLYVNLISDLVGIHKKPNSNMLYAATKWQILEITNDSIKVLKSFPVSENIFDWFPLAVGNKWFYSSYERDYNPGFPTGGKFIGTKIMEVLKDTLINGKSYFLLMNNLLNKMIFDEKMYLRVDSTNGKIYKYWPELSGEFVFHDLNAEVGDTIMYPLIPDHPFYILQYEQPISFLDSNTFLREYWENLPCGCRHQLIKGFGLAYTVFDEFGGFEDKLKGCILNGTVIGDTAIVVGIKDDQNLFIVEFNLFQNYPIHLIQAQR